MGEARLVANAGCNFCLAITNDVPIDVLCFHENDFLVGSRTGSSYVIGDLKLERAYSDTEKFDVFRASETYFEGVALLGKLSINSRP